MDSRRGQRRPTVNAIDLDQIFLDRPIREGPRPAERSSIGADAGEADVGGFGNIDTEDVDEFGDGLPDGLPRSMDEPEGGSVHVWDSWPPVLHTVPPRTAGQREGGTDDAPYYSTQSQRHPKVRGEQDIGPQVVEGKRVGVDEGAEQLQTRMAGEEGGGAEGGGRGCDEQGEESRAGGAERPKGQDAEGEKKCQER